MFALETFMRKSSKLELSLLELVRMRASQINRCAACIDAAAIPGTLAPKERANRGLCMRSTPWRETPFFTDQERAAIGMD